MLAVLTLAHGRHDHLRAQVAGLAAGVRRPDLHVVVAMDDPAVAQVAHRAWRAAGNPPPVLVEPLAADPLGLPLAAARNAAARVATAAGADRLVFLDVDCIPGPTTLTTYARHLHPSPSRPSPAVLGADVAYLPPRQPGCGGWEHQLYRLAEVGVHRPDRVRPAPGETRAEPDLTRFWSLSFALTAADFARTGGFCPLFVGYGGEDTDFAQVVGSLGGSLTWVGGATAYHQHHPTRTPPVDHVEAVVRNAGVFADRWGWWPMLGWLEQLRERGLAAPDGDGRWQVTR
ncbi:glycosyltransferase family 2 protein [Serinicoccus marinus]|uniref:glycosyltransferase family 2 protein n=1 Tax=Serinicoccus marinus TaxID=247333 RepID=UPI00193105D2|nr:galactosyltransferase-related protein [Serinicoccus marinus]